MTRSSKMHETYNRLVEASGLSQRELSHRLGMSKNYVGQRVRGKRTVKPLDLYALQWLVQVQMEQVSDPSRT
jgi:transcriptional regulator with XRE-family HTH domain